ncbi:MAG TPA: hypothetical protein VJN93_16620 [Candidatus Acidoferrum sp.]|nr:hypothetical protein [Candidatus Acidoferrum sp.]
MQTLSIALVILGLQLFSGASTQAQTVNEIVVKILQARGGVEKAKSVRSVRITGKIYFNAEMYGPFLAEFKRPGMMHNEVTLHDKTVIRTFNGKDGGWIINPFNGQNAPEPMTAAEMKDAADEADFDGPLIDSEAKGNKVELTGIEQVEGRDAYILKVTHKDGTVSNFSYDTKTYLLAKWSGTDMQEGQAVGRETYFRDYRDVAGLKFAFELESKNPGGEYAQKIVVDKIEVDPAIDNSHFGKPAVPAGAQPATPNNDPPGLR